MSNMFNIIMKNFFSKKATRLYPIEKEREPFLRSRGRIQFDKTNCILCSLCARKCPADAITVDRTNGKWQLNCYRCVICGACVTACPKKCITMNNQRRKATQELITEDVDVPIKKPPVK